VQGLVDLYIKATADEPGEVDHLAAFQRHHLGKPYPYKVALDLGAGDDFTSMWTARHGGYFKPEWFDPERFKQGGEHRGGVRMVGERGGLERSISWSKSPFLPSPELLVMCPRRTAKATMLQALEAARRERWCRDLDREIRHPASWDGDDLEGSSCD
jgi:hypothetical protein